MLSAKITGTGSFLPELIVTNKDFEKMVDTTDEWIVTRSGIRQRHISTGVTNWEMGVSAAQTALNNAGADPDSIDMIIGTTSTPDYFYPSLASIAQLKLDAINATCFDIRAACTGFTFAFDVAWQYIRNGKAKKILIVSSEVMSKVLDFTDRSTSVLFGDGAGAILLERCETGGVINSFTMSEVDKKGLLACKAVDNNSPFATSQIDLYDGINDHFVHMNGRETFKFTARAVPYTIEKVLEGTGLSIKDIDHIVPHQANIRIIETVAKRCGIDYSKMIVSIDKYANTSSASMPIALHDAVISGIIKPKDKVIFVGFGAGLTYGALLVEW